MRPSASESLGYLLISQWAGHRLFEAKSYPDSFKGWRHKWVWVTPVDDKLQFTNKWGELIRKWVMPFLSEGNAEAARMIVDGVPFLMGYYVGEDRAVMLSYLSASDKMASRLERLAVKAGSTPGPLVPLRKTQIRGAIGAAPAKPEGSTPGDGAVILPTLAIDPQPPPPPLTRGLGRGRHSNPSPSPRRKVRPL
ncbi:unnamed protein product [Cuscuta europaea]|uniref:Uncharacterized protein n=1 Tax=Cuscuta europaea TaxID=41803 RepID=A0A9P1E2L4_CUSEU|nr:unnamed protein product [Cuscuta europaea]